MHAHSKDCSTPNMGEHCLSLRSVRGDSLELLVSVITRHGNHGSQSVVNGSRTGGYL